MSFQRFNNDFPGLCRRLLMAKSARRIAHGFVLVGDSLEYIEEFGRAWAMACACRNPLPDGDACGACRSCVSLQKNIYTDMQVLRPQSKARMIRIDEMHEFERFLGLTAAAPGNLKIGLILDADRMTTETQNAFLKTLEEPTPNTMLMLLTTQPARLLTTIRSRCQCLSLLRNQTDFSFARERGLFDLLAELRPAAGAAVALRCAGRLSEMFLELHGLAQQNVASLKHGGCSKEHYDSLDKTNKKRLDDEDKAREQAEYLNLQLKLLAGIQTWFQQQVLAAAGLAAADLPHPELAGDPPDLAAAETCARLVDELIGHLAANVSEPLALDAFCLEICERRHN